MMIHRITDCSNIGVIKLLQRGLSTITDENYVKNYHPDYINYPGNLFFILKNGRYRRGIYYVIEEDGQYIFSSGWNEYEMQPEIALLLTRTYIMPSFRNNNLMSKLLFSEILNSTQHYQKRWITVNSYNSVIYKWLKRWQSNKKSAPIWPEIFRNFVPIGMHEIYYTQQYVAEYVDNNKINLQLHKKFKKIIY